MKTVQVNIHEAKTNLSRLVAGALEGDEVILAKAGRPVAKIIPLPQGVGRKAGLWAGSLSVPDSFFEPMPEEELDAWES